MKSGNLNFLEASGPLQACNGTAFYISSIIKIFSLSKILLGKTRYQFNLRLGDKSKNPRQYLFIPFI
jgi:hypothetical protein